MDTLTTKGLMRLMTWLSPSFPVGAYTYSHGIEYAVEQGLVSTGASLQNWVEGILRFGAGQSDAMIFVRAWHLADQGLLDDLVALNHHVIARRPTLEIALETESQGRAFIATLCQLVHNDQFSTLCAKLKDQVSATSYPVIVGAACGFDAIACPPALIAYLHSFAANLVSAGVRLVPLGQTAGQQALQGLEAIIEATAQRAISRNFADLGSAAPMVDWTSMHHETQYTRLFRS